MRLLTGSTSDNISFSVQEALNKNTLHSLLDTQAGTWPIVESVLIARLGLKCIEGRVDDSNHCLERTVLETLKMAYGNLGFEPLPQEESKVLTRRRPKSAQGKSCKE